MLPILIPLPKNRCPGERGGVKRSPGPGIYSITQKRCQEGGVTHFKMPGCPPFGLKKARSILAYSGAPGLMEDPRAVYELYCDMSFCKEKLSHTFLAKHSHSLMAVSSLLWVRRSSQEGPGKRRCPQPPPDPPNTPQNL